jgi:ABC-type molybdate transport system ATPase subunit
MSSEDREAKALLNKFLGASVLMQGIEPLLQAQSPSLVSQVEKQRLAIAQVSLTNDIFLILFLFGHVL